MRYSQRLIRIGTATVATASIAIGAASCASDGNDTTLQLSEEGQRGRDVANSNGCAGCHGTEGQGGVGPGWQGLAGTEIELKDGSVAVVDDAYLTTAIVDPRAQERAGFTVRMPTNSLSDDEVAAVVAYIDDLADVGG